MKKTTIEGVISRYQKPIATPEQLEKLQKLDHQFVRVEKISNDHSHHAARIHGDQQVNEFQKQLREGGDVFDPIRLKESVVEEFRRKHSVCRDEMRKICAEALPIVREIAVKFAEACESVADALAADERKVAEQFGIEWQPSNVVAEIYRLPGQVHSYLKSAVSTQPAKLIPFLLKGDAK